MKYSEFIQKKQIMDVPTGIPDPGAFELHPALFDYQRDIVRWALRRGVDLGGRAEIRPQTFQGSGCPDNRCLIRTFLTGDCNDRS